MVREESTSTRKVDVIKEVTVLHRLEVLRSERVYRTFEFCESKYACAGDYTTIEVESITRPTPYTLYLSTVESYRELITKLLLQLPGVFIKSLDGKGAPYKEMGKTNDGTEWTIYLHEMDQLFMLGRSLGLMDFVSESERKDEYFWGDNPQVIVNL